MKPYRPRAGRQSCGRESPLRAWRHRSSLHPRVSQHEMKAAALLHVWSAGFQEWRALQKRQVRAVLLMIGNRYEFCRERTRIEAATGMHRRLCAIAQWTGERVEHATTAVQQLTDVASERVNDDDLIARSVEVQSLASRTKRDLFKVGCSPGPCDARRELLRVGQVDDFGITASPPIGAGRKYRRRLWKTQSIPWRHPGGIQRNG